MSNPAQVFRLIRYSLSKRANRPLSTEILFGFNDLFSFELLVSLLSGRAAASLLDTVGNLDIRLLLAGNVIDNGLEGARHSMAAFPQRVHDNCETRAEHPEDADYNPTAEERLAEDVAGSVPSSGMLASEFDRKSHQRIHT